MKSFYLTRYLALAMITFSVCACSHNNPLAEKGSEKDAGQLLYDAAKAVQPQINQTYHLKMDNDGTFYIQCVQDENANNQAEACNALFEAMAHYANTQAMSPFSTLSARDISDKAMWETVQSSFFQYSETDAWLPTD